MKRLPRFKNRTKANILWRFSERMTTSAALMLSSDLAFILIPMPASCRQGMSLSPSPIMIATFSPSFCTSLIHFIFIKVLVSGCWHSMGMSRKAPNFSTLSAESPDKI